MKQYVVAAGQGLDYDWSQDHISVKTPMELTDGRVSVVEDVLKPGFHLPAHRHRSMVEIFYILEGEVTFAFEDETVIATPGTTVTVPPNVRHEVTCPGGARLVTIFTPGGFDLHLAELATLTPVQLDDAEFIRELGERYDIWQESS
jgi:quercetin dioxygenase-like cupin family protein